MAKDERQQNSEDKFITDDDIRNLDYWNRKPIPEEQREKKLEVEPISHPAVEKGSSLTGDEIDAFRTHLAAAGGDNYCEVIALSVDIRKSAITLVNVEDFAEYNRVLTDFICYIKDTWRSQPGRFFDKFTGDGALCF